MQNEATFHIIGRVAKVTVRDTVAFVTIASNDKYQYNKGEWRERTQYVPVTFFRNLDWVKNLGKGDMIRVIGDIANTKRTVAGEDIYSTELHVTRQAILVRNQSDKNKK